MKLLGLYIRLIILGGTACLLTSACTDNITGRGPRSPISYKYEYHRDIEYVQNQIFDIRPPGDTLQAGDSIIAAAVFAGYLGGFQKPGTIAANVMMDPRVPSFGSIFQVSLWMEPLTDADYRPIVSERLTGRHYIEFRKPQRESAIGVWLKVHGSRNGRDTTFEIGNIFDSAKSLLMLRANIGSYYPSHPTWKLMWRNCYRISAHMDLENPDFHIFFGPIGTESDSANSDTQGTDGSFLELTGLDQYNRFGQNTPDGVIDEQPPVFRRDLGLIIFPSRTPFATDTTFNLNGIQTAPLEVQTPVIYNYVSLKHLADNSRYYFRLSVKEFQDRIHHK